MAADIIVETSWFVCAKEGFWTCSLSAAILVRAPLSRTTTESAFSVNLLMASKLLYGWTTTSPTLCVSGNTEYVCISFLGNRSFSFSSRKLPSPDPVPPAMECSSMKPSRESDPSASRSSISMTSS